MCPTKTWCKKRVPYSSKFKVKKRFGIESHRVWKRSSMSGFIKASSFLSQTALLKKRTRILRCFTGFEKRHTSSWITTKTAPSTCSYQTPLSPRCFLRLSGKAQLLTFRTYVAR